MMKAFPGWIILPQLLQNHTVTACSGHEADGHRAPRTRRRGVDGGRKEDRRRTEGQEEDRGRTGGGQKETEDRGSHLRSEEAQQESPRMRPRCRLPAVDRLPTISEQQEGEYQDPQDLQDHPDPGGPAPTMEEYMDSIKELSQPAPYPLHGPLRGHRRWTTCSRVKPATLTWFLGPHRSPTPWTPIDPSEVSLTLIDQSDFGRSGQNLLDLLVTQSQFAGLL